MLALLDFSSAFAIIDHSIIAHRLHTDFEVTGTDLQCLSSYLTDRTQYVYLYNYYSAFAPENADDPYCSFLCPTRFSMYIKPSSTIINLHSVTHHSFADDLQLPMSAPPFKLSKLHYSMQSCLSDIKAWAIVNMPNLNDKKTELMLVASKRTKHFLNVHTSITIGNAQVPFKQSVRNLGFMLDCHRAMNTYVTTIARTCCFELRRLASTCRFLTNTATATLVSALFFLSKDLLLYFTAVWFYS